MDVANSRSLGFAGKEILFRKVEFERYRKPHVVEYPRSAIVLNPQHTRQLKDVFTNAVQTHNGEENGEDAEEGSSRRHSAIQENSDMDEDDPRRIDTDTQLCSEEQFRSGLHLRWRHIGPVGLGLVNLGNTCFANSVLQALAHVPAVTQYFANTFRSADSQLGAPFDFAYALAETFRKMQSGNGQGRQNNGGAGGAYRPGLIMSNLRLLSKHFAIGQQSDAHEFAVQLLFACQKSLLHRLVGSRKVQPRVSHTTALYRLCGGYLLSQVTWSRQEEIQQLLRAGKQQAALDMKMEAKQQQQKQQKQRDGLDRQTLCSNTYDPFTILSVELAGHTLQHCLDKFCLAEELDGRCYHTPREVGVHAKKKFTIHVPPPVLLIHLKRFGPTGNKINKHVQFPLELDLSRYCSRPSSSPSFSSSEKDSARCRPDCQYALHAVCVHDGRSIHHGHYYTMAKSSSGMWYEFNDSHVSRLSEDRLSRVQAYMLCYARVPTATLKASSSSSKSGAVTNEMASRIGDVSARLPHAFFSGGVKGKKAATEDNAVGTELTEAQLQVLLSIRRAPREQDSSTSTNASERAAATTAFAEDEESNGALPYLSKAERTQTLKRRREELPMESDSEEDEEAVGEGLRRVRNGQWANGVGRVMGRLSPRTADTNGTARVNRVSREEEGEGEEAGQYDKGEEIDGERREASEDGAGVSMTAERTSSSSSSLAPSRYGGVIKSMRRFTSNGHGHPASNHDQGTASVPSSESTDAQPHYRVGRHAVNVLHARRIQSTPDSVKRSTSAPMFQQRMRDPLWEMEMDRGKVKKVKSKEKASDPFEGTNPFQEVSRDMFDIRGRRRRD